MTSADIIRILEETAFHLKLEVNQEELEPVRQNNRSYSVEDLAEFKRDLIEAGRKCSLFILEQHIIAAQLEQHLSESKDPLVIFQTGADTLRPDVLLPEKKHARLVFAGKSYNRADVAQWLQTEGGLISVLTIMKYEEVVSEDKYSPYESSPVDKLFKLFATEKKDITYILIYALIIGLLSLALPLGLQTTIEFVSGGVFFSSVYILIGLVILGVMATGILQIVQVSIVEQVQRRVFVKAALEFAYRLPRVRLEALSRKYAPELVNRFFDVTTIQKGLPKLLLDLSSGAIQVLFGLILLSLYHPFFIIFSFFLLGVFGLMFYFTGPRGLNSSLNESNYKYKVVQWLEEIARTLKSFKLAGNTDLPIRKTDQVAGNYIKYRKKHFGVLLTQLSFFVFLKVSITGGLLIMGTILVVDRQITLGQFVAAEVIIILVLSAVEKIILYIDVVYDLLTAVDKISHVTSLPLEKAAGLDLPKEHSGKGYSISLRDVTYRYPDNNKIIVDNVSLEIAAGEHICISGPGGSGKSTLANIISGLYTDYSGGVSINKFSLRDLDITHLRNNVAKNISADDIFDGTIYENITIGKSTARVDEVLEVVEKVGLSPYLHSLPQGLNTQVISGGKGLSSSTLHQLILARCLAKKPELLILNDFFSGLSKTDKLELIRCVIDPSQKWTLIIISNDPLVMASCNRNIIFDNGKVVADGSYSQLMKEGTISKYFE